MNHFADMTTEEVGRRNGYRRKEARNAPACATGSFPTSLDWRDASKNPENVVAVSNVKD